MATVYDTHCVRAYKLFKIGNNTAQIARIMKTDEPAVVKMIDRQRSRSRKLPKVQYQAPVLARAGGRPAA